MAKISGKIYYGPNLAGKVRGRRCGSEDDDITTDSRIAAQPMFSLKEQDEIAERFAKWWKNYYAENGKTPTREIAVVSSIKGIEKSYWKYDLFFAYCRDTGMLKIETS